MHRLRRALSIRPGEESTVVRLLSVMVLAWAGAAVGSAAVESLFFARFGAQNLPYMYIAVGLVTFPAMLTVTALLLRGDRRRSTVTLLLTLGAVVLALRGLLLSDARWVYPPLYLGMMVVWTGLGIVTWGLAGLVHDTRQAKRLFPLYGAGAILGGAIGGLVTEPLAALLHAENLLFLWATSLGVAFLLAKSLGARGRAHRRRLPGPRPQRAGLTDAIVQGMRHARRSRLAFWMSMTVVLLGVLYFSLSFQFAEEATARFSDPDRLAGFLGLFSGASNAVALLLSVILANRLFARVGVPTAVLTFPVIYLVGFVALALAPTFGPLVTFRFVQWVWMFGVWTTGWQALRTVIPQEWRDQVRVFMDGGALQFGVVLAGVLLLVAEHLLSRRQLFVVAAGLSAVAIGTSWLVRRSYAEALVEALRAGRPEVFVQDEEPFGGWLQDRAARETVEAGTADPDPLIRRLAVELLAEASADEQRSLLIEHVRDPDPGVRLAALRGVERSCPSGVLPTVFDLLHDGDPDIRATAVGAIVACSDGSGETTSGLRPLLRDAEVAPRLRAAAALSRSSDDPEARAVLRASAAAPQPEERAAAMATMGELQVEPGTVIAGLADADALVRSSAARALRFFGFDTAAEPLLAALREDDPRVREAVADALVSLGDDVKPGLVAALEDGRSEATALAALVRLPTPDLTILQRYAIREQLRALDYHLAWQRLSGGRKERVEPLVATLRHRAARHSEHAVHALAPFTDHAAVDLALEDLASTDANQRANAIETLESLYQPAFIRPLLGVWEPEGSGGIEPAEILASLLADDDPWIRACAAFATTEFADEGLRPSLEPLVHDPDAAVRESADHALSSLNGGASLETLSTLSLMDKVLALGKVPLFRELSPADLRHVAETVKENVFVDGTVIAEEGDPGDAMHVVMSGDVRVVMGEAQDEVARRGPGYIVGEMAIVAEQPRMASLVAAGDVRTLSIDRKRFQRILRDRPDAALAVMRELVARLHEANRPSRRDAAV